MEYLIEWQVLDSPDLYFERVTKQTNKVTSKSCTTRPRTEQTLLTCSVLAWAESCKPENTGARNTYCNRVGDPAENHQNSGEEISQERNHIGREIRR